MPIKQDERMLGITTALGAEKLAVGSFTLQEQISRLFQIGAELATEDGEIKLDDVIGQKATIRLNIGDNDKRYFNGYVSRMVQVANEGHYARYRATIVPWLWFLTRTCDCRIFQQKTVPTIIEDIFRYFGFSDYKLNLTANYPTWEYCVQYRETAFNFVSRLMEQEGIYYYFEHEDGNHTVVLADSIAAHKPFPGYAEVKFHEVQEGADEREVMTDWTMEKEIQPVAYLLQDFDFKKPKMSLLASASVTRNYGKAEYEIYDFPGEYLEHDEGQRLSDVRLNELQSQYELLHGQASARGLAAGCTFKLKEHPRGDQNRDYLITDVSIQADSGPFDTSGGAESFSCSLTAIDKSQQFRPTRLTPKPIVQGPQTAIVVGPSGEEIYTDEHARVKVHFPWDRYDKSDQDSSCWVRVSQYWAGKQWGSIHIPRIGQEVIVEFLEGDPDEPIITGRVYNADQTPPYGLPANKTQSGVKSRSSKGGSSANFNEIRFEDKKGSEMLTVHAEKDQEISVENDETHTVGHDRKKTIDHDETTQVKHDRTETVDNNETITIHGNRTETVDKDETITIHQNRTETVDKEESITIGGGRTENVAKDESITIGGARTENVSKDESVTIGGGRTENVSKDESITIGGGRTENVAKDESVTVSGGRTVSVSKDDSLTVGKTLSITAADEITITTGQASIHMKKDGTVEINGKDISVKGSGEITAKASKNVTMKGQKILQN
jgi:type VI secretion system secreted protein VgrG